MKCMFVESCHVESRPLGVARLHLPKPTAASTSLLFSSSPDHLLFLTPQFLKILISIAITIFRLAVSFVHTVCRSASAGDRREVSKLLWTYSSLMMGSCFPPWLGSGCRLLCGVVVVVVEEMYVTVWLDTVEIQQAHHNYTIQASGILVEARF